MLKLSPAILCLVTACFLPVPRVAAAPIPIAELNRSTPVDFQKEILPLLRKNCLACHSASDANGDLVLESPQTMLKGGDSGPAVVPGKSQDSLLLKLAAHQDDPVMPPPGNDVAAGNFTSQELALLKLWIDQGAHGEELANLLSPEDWRPLPPGTHPVYAAAVTPDGQFAACSRANQIFIYHVPTGQLVTRLNDPQLQAVSRDKRPGIAHLDIVQALAFNSEGDMLASGGFRTVKLWRYPRDVQVARLDTAEEVLSVAVSPDRQWIAVGTASGKITLAPAPSGPQAGSSQAGSSQTGTPVAAAPQVWQAHEGEVRGLVFAAQGNRLVSGSTDRTIRVWDVAARELLGRVDTPSEVNSVAVVPAPPAAEAPAAAAASSPASDTGEASEQASAVREWIVSGGEDNLVRVWELPTRLPQALPELPAGALRIAASADGQLLAVANDQGQVRVLDPRTGRLVQQWQAQGGPILSLDLVSLPSQAPAAAAQTADPAATSQADAADSSLPASQARLATAGADGSVQIWDARTGQRLHHLQGSLAPVQAVSFRADAQQLTAGAADGGLTVWNLGSLPVVPLEPSVGPETLAVVSADGKLVASSGLSAQRPAILVRELATGKLVHTLLGHEKPILSLAFHADNQRIVSGSADATARVWNLGEARFPEVARFSEHTGPVTAVAFNAAGTQVLSGSADHSVKLWNIADGQLVADFAGHTGAVVAVALPASNQPVSASSDKTIRFWNPANGQAVRAITEAAAVTSLDISRDGARLAVGLDDKTAKVYPVAGGAAQLTLAGHPHAVTSVMFSSDGTRLVTRSGDQRAMVWDLADGRLLQSLDAGQLEIPLAAAGEVPGGTDAAAGNAPQSTATASLGGVAFAGSPDKLIVGDGAGRMAVWPLRFQAALRGLTQAVTDVGYHPAGQLVLVSSQDGTLRGFNLANQQQAYSAAHGGAIRDLAISRDGQRVATGGDNQLVRLWNPANGAALQPAQLPPLAAAVTSLTFTQDGTRLVVGSEGQPGQLRVFDVATPAATELQALVGQAGGQAGGVVASVVLGPDDLTVSSFSEGGATTWRPLAIRTLAGHTQAVTSIAPSPVAEGQPLQVLTGSLDGTLRRWNLLTGQQLAQLNHGGPVLAVAVRGDGQRLASASNNKTIKLWNGANNAQIAQMQGDLRAKAVVATRTQQKNDATTKVATSKNLLAAAEKELPTRTMAEKTAAEALKKAEDEMQAKQAAFAMATTMKAEAEKKAIEAAATAQQAASALQEANQRALDLAAQTRLLAEKATRAQAIASATPDNQELAAAAAAAMKLAAETDAQAKAAEAAKAAPTKLAADTAQQAATAAQQALATNKPFNDAATALAQAQAARQSAAQAHEFAVRDLKLAEAAVPAAKQQVADAEVTLKQLEADLAAATQAETNAQQPVLTLAFSPDGATLATGGDLGIVHTWDAETGQAVSSYVGHEASIRSLAWLGDAQLVSGSADKSQRVWELNPQWRLERVIGQIDDPTTLVDRVLAVDFSEDGKLLATGSGIPSRTGEVKIWNVADGSLVRMLADAHNDAVTAVAFRPDGRQLASASADKYVKSFDVGTGELAMQFEGHTNHVAAVSWRAGGGMLASCGSDGTIRTWNADNGDRIRTIEGFSKEVTAVRFVGQTQFVVSAAGDPLVRKHNTDNGGVQTNYGGTTDYMYCVDATADPNNGVVIAGGHDGILRIWAANGQVRHALGPPADEEQLSPSDRQAAAR